jgi:hypothetical protein
MPIAGGVDLLDVGIQESLKRLQQNTINDEWWRKLLHILEHEYITPEFLQKPAIQDWLADERVGSEIKKLARARILGDDAIYEKEISLIRAAYAEKTGENKKLANGPIDIVLAVIALGYLASIDSALKPVVGILQATHEETRSRFDKIDKTLENHGNLEGLVKLLNENIRRDLDLILKRRSVNYDQSRKEISILAQQVWDGDYACADVAIRTNVLNWASRLHAGDKEHLAKAIKYRGQIQEINPSTDVRILDSIILETNGDIDDALKILRDIDCPDGYAVLFLVLKRRRGKEAALHWFEEQPQKDDPSFLTGLGWENVAITLAEADRWTDAIELLYAIQYHINEWPDLAYVEGVINAAMLLPEEYRVNSLQMNLFHPSIHTIEGPQADIYRKRAISCFIRAAEKLEEIGLEKRVHGANMWQLWLRLTDPKVQVAEGARLEIQEGLKNGKQGIDLLPFVRAFEMKFDPNPVRKYLAQRKLIGGLTDPEVYAAFLLAGLTMDPLEYANYLEQEELHLTLVIPKAVIIGTRIEAVVEAKQTIQAQAILDANKQCFDQDDYHRLQSMIEIQNGACGNARTRFEELYNKTKELIDLQNLINLLAKEKDWPALCPLLMELFRRERTIINARKVIQCMDQDCVTDDVNIIRFLNDNDDLVIQDQELASRKAWISSRLGQCWEARIINDKLLQERDNPVDLTLDINLAIQFGDRERFAAIIDREWSRRERYESRNLLHLAYIASDVDATKNRALELTKLAANKSGGDPQILIACYYLAVQLGNEDQPEVAEWFRGAISKSNENGPVTKVNMRTVAEKMMPAYRERSHKIEEALLQGEIPIHFASDALNMPLSNIILNIPSQNIGQPDGRRLTIIPIISGARHPVNISDEWAVGIDATSIMVLWYLDLLPLALQSFKKAILAPDTMTLFLNERRNVRFNQPSRIKKAEDICQLKLKTVQAVPNPPSWLVEEVGRDLAELLHLAKTSHGYVVRPLPIYKLSTFMEKEADLKDYAELILPTTTFTKLLRERGIIDSSTQASAEMYLQVHDHGIDLIHDPSSLDKLLLLDDLGAIYLQDAGILRLIKDSGIDFQVHPSMIVEQENLIEVNRGGEKLAGDVDKIRSVLRTALDDGKAVFLPRSRFNEKEPASRSESTLIQFITDVGECDAVCIDDRFINKHAFITDKKGVTAQTICVCDVLNYLENKGLITQDMKYEKIHRLRKGGFAFVPADAYELTLILRRSTFTNENKLIESAEMRVFRRSLMRLRSLNILQHPNETLFLVKLSSCCLNVITQLWRDKKLPIDRAYLLSDWVWRNISPSPLEWSTKRDNSTMKVVLDAVAKHTASLFLAIPMTGVKRQARFQEWMDDTILNPLLPANASLVDDISAIVCNHIARLVEELGNET